MSQTVMKGKRVAVTLAFLALLLGAACQTQPAGTDAGPEAGASAVGHEPWPVGPHYAPAKKFGAVVEGQTASGSIQAIPLVATDDAGGVAVAVTSTAAGTLPAGGATAAKQDTGNTSLGSIDTKVPAKGTAAMAGSLPVTLATNDTLGLTLATAANQTTGNSSLSSIATNTGRLPSQGSAAMAGSVPVTLATNDTIAATLATTSNQTSGAQKAQRVDGSGNVAPAGDTVGRAGFCKITDGVTTVGVDVTTTGQKTIEQNQPVYEDNTAGVAIVEHRYSGANQTSAATTTIKTGAGLLHAVNVGTCVANATIKFFDNTAGSGTSVAVITCPATVANPFTLIFDRTFATGLTVVTSGATDVSESYR